MLWYVYATEANLVVKPDLVDRGRASPTRGPQEPQKQPQASKDFKMSFSDPKPSKLKSLDPLGRAGV